eukprot:CAMPEP_0185901178 /NCGR_PEP_ID=MMETSP0196C-20130402/559_1 /TAXON_ID=2932 /ORGANISM="Alexandrium fundyense, Strain CCMP1719" /LENGTH=61 /DNA_ID=CAMNT_0028619793 /DNA_START=96 /DNA_END=281 /DNA_ORIENTATION=-
MPLVDEHLCFPDLVAFGECLGVDGLNLVMKEGPHQDANREGGSSDKNHAELASHESWGGAD